MADDLIGVLDDCCLYTSGVIVVAGGLGDALGVGSK